MAGDDENTTLRGPFGPATYPLTEGDPPSETRGPGPTPREPGGRSGRDGGLEPVFLRRNPDQGETGRHLTPGESGRN